MTTPREFIKARLKFLSQDLDSVLSTISDADLNWAPTPGMRTVAEQLIEIANKEREAIAWLKTDAWPDDEGEAFDPETATLSDIHAVRARLRS